MYARLDLTFSARRLMLLLQARLFSEADNLVMKTTRAIKKGEQIFNDYGALPRSDVLRRYGYITPGYAQYDVVEISHRAVVDVVQEYRTLSGHLLTARVSPSQLHEPK